MPEAVVDRFEPVQVEEQQSEWTSPFFSLTRDRRLQKLDKLVAIRESGKRIVIGGVSKLFTAFTQSSGASFEFFNVMLKFLDVCFSLFGSESFCGLGRGGRR